jgi:predicted Rossmann fold nucleotide-binding protein DprA/Smf involved in DNA uptake
LIVTPFGDEERRPTARMAQERNGLAVALADKVLVAHASPGGRLMRFTRTLLPAGKDLYTLGDAANAGLAAMGLKIFDSV